MAEINITGLQELVDKFKQSEQKLHDGMQLTMNASLDTLQESVPPYPPRPQESTYIRTGTLGRSLGASGAKPDIKKVTGTVKTIQGAFGTRINYAPYVISDDKQAYMHRGRWWTMQTVADKARDKIERLWQKFIEVFSRGI